jgi:ubiquinol-cytochrome c reductase cytochrome b subunit
VAFFVLIFWVIQVVSGVLLLGLLSYNLDIQFIQLLVIGADGNFVWLLRIFHMIGANWCVILLFFHFGKALGFSRILSTGTALLWLSGALIFLLSLGVAFTGYVLVSGNMSFWAALVILNIFTVIPLVGEELVFTILSGPTVNSWSIRRFSLLHFLLAVVALAVVILHLILLHRSNPSKSHSDIATGDEFLIGVLLKDLALGVWLLLLVFGMVWRGFIHPDNWQDFSRVSTPEHIEPELYFLWSFSIIKLHNGKVVGFFGEHSGAGIFLGLIFSTVAATQFLDQLSAVMLEFGISLLIWVQKWWFFMNLDNFSCI